LIPFALTAGINDVDAQGWTILEPSEDSRLVYVSSSDGDDTNDGLTPETAKATIDAGAVLIRDGFPDWLMLKRGDTFGQPNLGRWKNGRSADEPLVVTAYGEEGPRPVIKLTNDFVNWSAQPRNHTAYVGLDFYRSISDPDSEDFTDTSCSTALGFFSGDNSAENILVEDCRFRYCWLVSQGQNDGPFISNVVIRRNIIRDTWVHGSTETEAFRIQGMFVRGTMGFVFEENLMDHNGWNAGIPDANANQYNHNLYIQRTNGGGILVRGNIISRAAAHGVQLRSGGDAVMNAFVGNAIGMNLGYSTPPAYPAAQTTANDNVFTDGRPQVPNDSDGVQTGAIWGLWKQEIENVSVNDNIVANLKDDRGNNMKPYQSMSANDFGTGNIGWNWDRNNEPESDPGWLDPDRNADSFAQTLGLADWDAFIDAAAERGPGEMPFDLTAYAYVNYIREGFNKEPVDPPYVYDGTEFELWGGFVIDEEGNVDTGSLIGWINVLAGDWIWVWSLEKYVYLPESFVTAFGAWSYNPY
jgi:hypothetical protein